MDVDGHNFPNLALMKLSSYHKMIGDSVGFVNNFENYDRVYISKVFTWSNEDDTVIKCDDVIRGGTGYDLTTRLSNFVEYTYPDYSLYNIDYALGFLSRGCPRGCGFCIVKDKEGSAHKVANLDNFWRGQRIIKLLDPNILACIDAENLLQQLIDSKAYVDFTQGLDIRLLVSNPLIDMIKRIKIKRIHFAYDDIKYSGIIEAAMINFKKHTGWGRGKVSVYILTNYNSTIEEDMHRIEFCKSIDFNPYVMVYDKDKLDSGSIYYRLQRWCNNPMFLYTNTFKEYLDTAYKSKSS